MQQHNNLHHYKSNAITATNNDNKIGLIDLLQSQFQILGETKKE